MLPQDRQGAEPGVSPLLVVVTLAVVVGSATLILLGPSLAGQARDAAILFGIVTVAALVMRRNQRAGVIVLVVCSWAWITATIIHYAGIYSTNVAIFPRPIAFAGWMLGRRWLVAITALSVAAVLYVGVGEYVGWYAPHQSSPALVRTVILVGVVTMTGVVVGTAYENLGAARRRALEIGERLALHNIELTRREQEVRELNAELERRVAARTAELTHALETLQRAQEDLARAEAHATFSALVASVSHDLASPLGNALMASTTLHESVAEFNAHLATGQLRRSELTALSTTLGDGTDIITRNLRRAEELLRKFKQVAADQASEQRRRFDLADTVGEVVVSLTPAIRRLGHRVEVDIPVGIACDSYPGPLGQVVVNLVNNAFLHAFEGRHDGSVRISAVARGERVAITVSDDGAGMTADVRERLFQPYFSTKIGKGGTGLGMTIVDTIVRKTLGGEVSVESAPGHGTRIEIDIPRVAASPSA